MHWFFLLAVALTAQNIDQPQPFRAGRVSSAAPDGANGDAATVAPGAAFTVAEIKGPGRIVHTWFTLATDEPDYLHTTRLRIYWDGAAQASVDVPFGEFHLLGHGKVRQIQSTYVTVEARAELNHNLPNKNVAGFNTFFPMPYASGARIVIENASKHPIRALYYQIDYQKWAAPPSPLRFHAFYSRSAPEPFPGPEAGKRTATNPDGKANHPIVDVQGRGHFIGVALSVDATGIGWWEGDEMIWIDGEAKASILGTGTEDYFGGAWGFRREYNMPSHGVSFMEKVPERTDWQAGRYTVYRFHPQDPIPFERSFRMSIERGHNNHRRDSTYSSVAFFYRGTARR